MVRALRRNLTIMSNHRTPLENLYCAICSKTKSTVNQPVLKALRRGVVQIELPQEQDYLSTLSILVRNRNARREVTERDRACQLA